MMRRNLNLPLLLSTLLLTSGSLAQPSQESIWQGLVDADREFSQRATSEGRTASFLEVLTEDSVVFRNGPVGAREIYQSEAFQRSADHMSWNSHFVDVSRAGDLGLTAGPMRLTAQNSGGEGERESYGYMIGVWRNIDESWKLVADIVVTIPGILSLDVEPDFADTLKVLNETAHPVMVENTTLQSLVDADNLFGQSINFRGGQRAQLRFGLENQRVYLPGMAPAVSIELSSAVYGKFLDNQLFTTNPVSLTYVGGYLSESGELGYTYGVMSTNTTELESGFQTNYLRLWRFTDNNEWRIALEVLDPY